MPKRLVPVGNKTYEVNTQRIHKTAWKASGNYEGHIFEGRGRTESAALMSWAEAAKARAV
ncbi:MAG TPA: hypothetical protein VKT54_13850 [Steroidobacteraceae bacterium]|nr:hypothetical protein [Steroidobacteraceae bacterium]